MKRTAAISNSFLRWLKLLIFNIKALEKKEKTILLTSIFGIILLIILIISITILFMKCNSDSLLSKKGNQIVHFNKEIYAVLDDDQKIYNVSGENKTLISDIPFCSNLIEHKNYLYFIGGIDIREQGIYKLNLLNGQYEILCKGLITQFYIYDHWIYFIAPASDGSQISKIKIDGSRIQELSQARVSNFIIYKKWIYFCNENGDLYKLRINGEEEQKLSDNLHIYSIIVSEKNIFYLDKDTFHIMKCDFAGKNPESIVDSKCADFVYFKGQIYYTDDKEEGLFSIDEYGKNKKTIINEKIKNFYILNDKIYYYNKEYSVNYIFLY